MTALAGGVAAEMGAAVTVLDAAVLAHDVAVIVFRQGNLTRTMIDIGPQVVDPAPGATRAMNMIVKAAPGKPEQ